MSETPTYEDGWQPIETAPSDYDWYCDLPGEEDEGVGHAIADEDSRMAFLLWFASPKPGYSKPTHWRPLPSPPAFSRPEAVEEESR